MVYKIRKVKGKELFSVKNAETGKIHAHATTKANAKKQVKLLQAIDHGFVPSKDELEGAGFGETLINLYNRIRGIRRDTIAPAPPNNINPMGPLAPVNRNQIVPINVTEEMLYGPRIPRNQIVPLTEEQKLIQGYDLRPNKRGSGRMNPAVQTMLTYLKSLYPNKTLISVANEILKITGHQMSGRGRKPIKATEIAKYIIASIGVALAIAVALFLLNNEIQEEKDYQKSLIKIEDDRQRERERRSSRDPIVSVFDDPNSELYKQREMYKKQAQEPIQIPEMIKPVGLPISTPKPVSKSKGPSDSYKKEVEKVKERLIELDNKKKEEDRQKLMAHLYDDFDGRKPRGSGRKRKLRRSFQKEMA